MQTPDKANEFLHKAVITLEKLSFSFTGDYSNVTSGVTPKIASNGAPRAQVHAERGSTRSVYMGSL